MEQRPVSMQEFKDVLENRIERMREVMAAKNAEYASGQDKCHNFNAAARVNDTTPEDALWGMYTKHLVSIMDLIGWVKTAPHKITRSLIDEKMGDAVNYHVLLEALLLALVRDRDGVLWVKPEEV